MGGFSICSSPRELKESNTIELAVKHSQHPPALWVHTKVCVYNVSFTAQVYFVCFNTHQRLENFDKNVFFGHFGALLYPRWHVQHDRLSSFPLTLCFMTFLLRYSHKSDFWGVCFCLSFFSFSFFFLLDCSQFNNSSESIIKTVILTTE